MEASRPRISTPQLTGPADRTRSQIGVAEHERDHGSVKRGPWRPPAVAGQRTRWSRRSGTTRCPLVTARYPCRLTIRARPPHAGDAYGFAAEACCMPECVRGLAPVRMHIGPGVGGQLAGAGVGSVRDGAVGDVARPDALMSNTVLWRCGGHHRVRAF